MGVAFCKFIILTTIPASFAIRFNWKTLMERPSIVVSEPGSFHYTTLLSSCLIDGSVSFATITEDIDIYPTQTSTGYSTFRPLLLQLPPYLPTKLAQVQRYQLLILSASVDRSWNALSKGD